MAKKRLTRSESQEITRGRLLDSAQSAFVKEGFAASAIDKITERAGYSRGAFYANFKTKDDLFLVLLERYMSDVITGIRSVANSNESQKTKITKLREMYLVGVHNKEMCLLMTELFLYSIRNAKVKEKLNRINQTYLSTVSSLVADFVQENNLGISAEQVTLYLFSLGQGLSLQHLADPKFVSKDACEPVLNYAFDILQPKDQEDGRVPSN